MNITGIASGSGGNCYLITDDDNKHPLLIEAGLPPKKLKRELWDRGISISEINFCLISHEHQDHFKSAEFLTNHSVNLILPKTDEEGSNLDLKRKDRVYYAGGNKIYKANHYLIRTMDMNHDGVPILGFFIKHESGQKIFYATDTMYIKYRPEGVNYFMIEVNYQKKYLEEAIKEGQMTRANMRRIMRSHMGLDTALDFLKAADLSQAKEIYAIHHSQRNSNPIEIKETLQAETGLPVYVL